MNEYQEQHPLVERYLLSIVSLQHYTLSRLLFLREDLLFEAPSYHLSLLIIPINPKYTSFSSHHAQPHHSRQPLPNRPPSHPDPSPPTIPAFLPSRRRPQP